MKLGELLNADDIRRIFNAQINDQDDAGLPFVAASIQVEIAAQLAELNRLLREAQG